MQIDFTVAMSNEKLLYFLSRAKGIIYFIAQRTRPVMVNDLVRVSRTAPYECTVPYLYGAGN